MPLLIPINWDLDDARSTLCYHVPLFANSFN